MAEKEKRMAEKERKENGKKMRTRSFLICTLVVAFFVFLLSSVCLLCVDIVKTDKETETVKEATSQQIIENDKLRQKRDSKNTDEIIADEAREKYGFVEQGERVYCDVSATE